VFRVDEFPQPDGKVQAKGFFVVNGGCAANAAVAIARLGGRAALAGPMGGPAGDDDNGDRRRHHEAPGPLRGLVGRHSPDGAGPVVPGRAQRLESPPLLQSMHKRA